MDQDFIPVSLESHRSKRSDHVVSMAEKRLLRAARLAHSSRKPLSSPSRPDGWTPATAYFWSRREAELVGEKASEESIWRDQNARRRRK